MWIWISSTKPLLLLSSQLPEVTPWDLSSHLKTLLFRKFQLSLKLSLSLHSLQQRVTVKQTCKQLFLLKLSFRFLERYEEFICNSNESQVFSCSSPNPHPSMWLDTVSMLIPLPSTFKVRFLLWSSALQPTMLSHWLLEDTVFKSPQEHILQDLKVTQRKSYN